MDATQLLEWGRAHNYPQLVLTHGQFPCDMLRAGEQAWYGLVEGNNPTRIQRAVARIQDFENRYSVATTCNQDALFTQEYRQ